MELYYHYHHANYVVNHLMKYSINLYFLQFLLLVKYTYQHNWHDGNDNKVPFIKYILGTILAAYKDFEERFNLIETKKSALEIVREATYIKIGKFTKQDIKELCPSLSISSIEGSLRKLVELEEIARIGKGKNISYYRIK